MTLTSEIRRGRRCVFLLHVDLVFVTKYRKKVFQKKHLDFLKLAFERIAKDFGCYLKEMNGEEDHVHLLIDYPPKVSISRLTNSLKGVSSRMLRKNYPEMGRSYWRGNLWSPSYFAGSCGGAPLEVIRKYIESQSRPKI